MTQGQGTYSCRSLPCVFEVKVSLERVTSAVNGCRLTNWSRVEPPKPPNIYILYSVYRRVTRRRVDLTRTVRMAFAASGSEVGAIVDGTNGLFFPGGSP